MIDDDDDQSSGAAAVIIQDIFVSEQWKKNLFEHKQLIFIMPQRIMRLLFRVLFLISRFCGVQI